MQTLRRWPREYSERGYLQAKERGLSTRQTVTLPFWTSSFQDMGVAGVCCGATLGTPLFLIMAQEGAGMDEVRRNGGSRTWKDPLCSKSTGLMDRFIQRTAERAQGTRVT